VLVIAPLVDVKILQRKLADQGNADPARCLRRASPVPPTAGKAERLPCVAVFEPNPVGLNGRVEIGLILSTIIRLPKTKASLEN
jgi:hypothetical protein